MKLAAVALLLFTQTAFGSWNCRTPQGGDFGTCLEDGNANSALACTSPIERPLKIPSNIVLFAAGIAATYIFLQAYAFLTHDSIEPNEIVGTIPFIIHLLGMP
ncbi:hypothetical protein F4809DRAFT_647108 [Biscogniauxia mediterranea]|nr:hypothetical protein F4809DRAFT_647108 [Biscogniauxia mediterranea]